MPRRRVDIDDVFAIVIDPHQYLVVRSCRRTQVSDPAGSDIRASSGLTNRSLGISLRLVSKQIADDYFVVCRQLGLLI